MKRSLKSVLVVSCLTINATSVLALDINNFPSENKTMINSPAGRIEICAQAHRMIPAAYKDKDDKDESELCSYNFYSNMALCPKLNSTNPGVLVANILTGKSREQTMAVCTSNNDISVQAKFKNSISCSYTPSILAYYHFSRMLKAGNVPVAVLRTMDKTEHKTVVQRALNIISNSSEIIYKTWKSFFNAHEAAASPALFDTSKQFVYGALADNPKKEYRYYDISGKGVYDTRYQRFLQQQPYLNVTSPLSISQIAGSTDIKKTLPLVVQMKDVSDMILLDTLLSQDDRIGNIHYKLAWYSIDKNPETGKLSYKTANSKTELASDGKSWVIPENEKAIQASGAQLIREILMKDNDCGVNVKERSNMMRQISAIENVRHISARTYKKFLEMYQIAKTPEFTNWLKNELMFTSNDIGAAGIKGMTFIGNLEKAYSILNTNCKNGKLKLDLNVDDLIPGHQPTVMACDL